MGIATLGRYMVPALARGYPVGKERCRFTDPILGGGRQTISARSSLLSDILIPRLTSYRQRNSNEPGWGLGRTRPAPVSPERLLGRAKKRPSFKRRNQRARVDQWYSLC